MLAPQFIAWKTFEAVTMSVTGKHPNEISTVGGTVGGTVVRYWMLHGPCVLQLPPYVDRVLQELEYHGPFELEFAMWFFQYPGVSALKVPTRGSQAPVEALYVPSPL